MDTSEPGEPAAEKGRDAGVNMDERGASQQGSGHTGAALGCQMHTPLCSCCSTLSSRESWQRAHSPGCIVCTTYRAEFHTGETPFRAGHSAMGPRGSPWASETHIITPHFSGLSSRSEPAAAIIAASPLICFAIMRKCSSGFPSSVVGAAPSSIAGLGPAPAMDQRGVRGGPTDSPSPSGLTSSASAETASPSRSAVVEAADSDRVDVLTPAGPPSCLPSSLSFSSPGSSSDFSSTSSSRSELSTAAGGAS